jgi:transcription elongation factor S-II
MSDGEDIRSKCIDKLDTLIHNFEISSDIEESIYEKVVLLANEKRVDISWNDKFFKRLYRNKAISIYLNLNVDSDIKNTNLLNKVLNGQIDAKKLAHLTPQEMFPEHWEKFLERCSANNEFLYTRKPEVVSDMFKCGKCKNTRTSYYQVQTRSSDEPMTTFITCLDCGQRWKQ